MAETLDELLARWRSTYDGNLGAAIEALGASYPPVELELPSKQGDAAKLWIARVIAARPEELTSLIDLGGQLVERVAGRTAWPCIETLVSLDPDPRVAALALAYLSGARTPKEFTAKLRRRLFDAMERHADSRALPALATMIGTLDPYFVPRAQNLVKKIEKRVTVAAKSPGQVAVTDRSDARGDELLAAIYEAPGDDSRRQVYADWLLQRSDPRGELINLQFQRAAGAQTAKGAAREAALLKKHVRSWYAGIWSALSPSSVVVEKGFLASCAFGNKLTKTKAHLVAIRPEWATVHTLQMNYVAELASTMRAVRRLHGIGNDQLDQIARTGITSLDDLEVRFSHGVVTDQLVALLGGMPVAQLGLDVQAYPHVNFFDVVRAVLQTSHGRAVRALTVTLSAFVGWDATSWDWRALERMGSTQFAIALGPTARVELHRIGAAWSHLVIRLRESPESVHVTPWRLPWSAMLAPLRDRLQSIVLETAVADGAVERTPLYKACAALAPVTLAGAARHDCMSATGWRALC